VRDPLFAGTAFGTAVLAVACNAVALRSQLRGWCLSFALLYLIGVIGTTLSALIAQSSWRASRLLTATHAIDLACWKSHTCGKRSCGFAVAWLGFRQSASNK